ncbi:TetR/AcrR family transcriptional regulator [Alkaliphilus sp. MSJ-5]|uniref:TetR/AcrR family transcriptional regulator n=1 Tax=Alkaliphilus flagellatus TaxID=2841507 RepID=A0ABS6G222_9FIRM|nr:TetR/AcrR family transcriptional regulator [Alkaliphilus flagellatus]
MNSLKEQKRIDIIEAATKIFRRYGFHKAKIEVIAKEAGIGKGTVYEYFDSKKDLFEQMIKYMAETYLNMAREAMDIAETVKEKLMAFAQHHGNFVSEHMDMAENVIPGPGFLSEEMKYQMIEMKQSIFLLIDEALEMGIETGELRPDLNKRIATFSILGAINHNYALQVYFESVNPKDIDSRPIIDTVFNGLSNK